MTTANAPETAMPTLRLSRRASDQSEQHAWPATGCVTSFSKDSPSVAASVANQSPGGANTSNPAPVLVFFFWTTLELGTRQRCRARTEAINLSCTSASASAVRSPARYEAWFTTAFFPQGVHISADVVFLGQQTSRLSTSS